MLDDNVTPDDIRYLAANLREADRMEVAAASGRDPQWVLTEGVIKSAVSLVYRARRPVFIVGVVEPGIIWLLGSDAIHHHKRALHRLAGHVLTKWHERWPTLGNIVDARNTIHIRWLKSMGFQFGEPVIAGVARLPFLPFWKDSHAPDTRGDPRSRPCV